MSQGRLSMVVGISGLVGNIDRGHGERCEVGTISDKTRISSPFLVKKLNFSRLSPPPKN